MYKAELLQIKKVSVERLYKLCMIAGSLNCNTLEKQQKFIVKNFAKFIQGCKAYEDYDTCKTAKIFCKNPGWSYSASLMIYTVRLWPYMRIPA
jgi:hypothetical protein